LKIAYFDCSSGIAGDMTLAALVDAGADPAAISQAVARLDLPVELTFDSVRRAGIRANYARITAQPEHAHRHLHHIEGIIQRAALSPRATQLALQIFRLLGEAEAHAHGIPIEKVHFHEVGAVDSIVDIVASAVACDLLGIDRVEASPVAAGSGFVHAAHGRMSVPAPATAFLLQGIPLAPSSIELELTTPTGAAILKALARRFGPIPAMTISAIGHGAGTRDFPGQANILRVFLGESAASSPLESLYLLETNLDDTTPETLGYVHARLMAAGALDAFFTPILMKKSRPAVLLSVLAPQPSIDALEAILFRETPTLGIRRREIQRHALPRQHLTIDTTFGPIPGKISWFQNDPPRFSPEHDACAQLAQSRNLPLARIVQAAELAFLNSPHAHTPPPADSSIPTPAAIVSPAPQSHHDQDHAHHHHHDHEHHHHHHHESHGRESKHPHPPA
jgi:uncharacterized protein (TIGR00299 family) protein